MGRALFEKVWDEHVVRDLGDGWALLHIDRHLVHDLGGAPAFGELKERGLEVHDPALAFAVADHAVSSEPGRTAQTFPLGGKLFDGLRAGSAANGIRFFELGQRGQGIVHVMAPELGIVLPGASVVCGDSHTCTNGALGALAFGIGSSELLHVLATQTLRQRRPRLMRIRCDRTLARGVTAKDLALHLIAKLSASAGVGFAIEYAGAAVEGMDIESRLTLCNLTVELGAKVGMIAPDERTIDWLRGRVYAPLDAEFERAGEHWRTLVSDPDAVFDVEVTVDAAEVVPTVTWGTSPDQAIAITQCVPDPALYSGNARASMENALDYMGLTPGEPIAGTPVDWVFIGSCANSRLSDLESAAEVVKGHHVAPGVTAWVVPGSENVKRAAEAAGLDAVFKAAGLQWREPGCSMCVAANGEQVPSGARCVSTSNRNFVGRQGPGARTHLASPAMAAAAAISGRITDVRSFR